MSRDGSWRAAVSEESRALTRKLVVDFLARHVTSTNKADKMQMVAFQVEETVWSKARSARDYTERINRKLQRVENSKSQPAGKENGTASRSVHPPPPVPHSQPPPQPQPQQPPSRQQQPAPAISVARAGKRKDHSMSANREQPPLTRQRSGEAALVLTTDEREICNRLYEKVEAVYHPPRSIADVEKLTGMLFDAHRKDRARLESIISSRDAVEKEGAACLRVLQDHLNQEWLQAARSQGTHFVPDRRSAEDDDEGCNLQGLQAVGNEWPRGATAGQYHGNATGTLPATTGYSAGDEDVRFPESVPQAMGRARRWVTRAPVGDAPEKPEALVREFKRFRRSR